MTYMSLRILHLPGDPKPEQFETAETAREVVLNLDHLARGAGPYAVGDWARNTGLPAYYVDNCWVRVPVTPDQLERFNSGVLKGAAALEGVLATHCEAAGWLVIEAEEF
jgi:hypothetical protein